MAILIKKFPVVRSNSENPLVIRSDILGSEEDGNDG